MKRLAVAAALAAALGLAACTLGGGTSDETGSGTVKFRQITGSSTITVHLLGAGGKTFQCGASGVKWGQLERMGISVSVGTNDESYIIESSPSNDYLFAGGQVIGLIGGIIDEGTPGLGDGDRIAFIPNYTVASNATITLNYPADFTAVSGSGNLTVRLLNAAGKKFSYGANGIPWGQSERLGGNVASVADADESYVIQAATGGDYLFLGGQVIGSIGGIIDEDLDNVVDDGDRVALTTSHTVNGSATITLNYPADFTAVSGSSSIAVNVTGANAAMGGKPLNYGASGIKWGQYERIGDQTTVSSDSMALVVHQTGQPSFLFGGGQVVGGIGAIIDADNDTLIDNGDYIATTEGFTVAPGASVTFAY